VFAAFLLACVMRAHGTAGFVALWLILLAGATIVLLGPLRAEQWVFDDSFIGLTYAKNLASGNGFTFNGVRVLGTTAPLPVLAYAALARLTGLDAARIASLVGLVSLVLSPIVWAAALHPTAFRALPPSLLMAHFALWAFSPYFLTLFGHETLPAITLLGASVALIARHRWFPAGVVGACAALCRAETALVVGAAAVALGLPLAGRSAAMKRSAPPLGGLVSLGRVAAGALVLIAPILLYELWSFGTVVSHSFSSKAAQTTLGNEPFLPGSFRWLRDMYTSSGGVMLSAIFLAAGALQVRHLPRAAGGALVGLVAWCSLYPILDLPFYHWFVVPLVLAAQLLISWGVTALLMRFARVAVARAGLLFLAAAIVFASFGQLFQQARLRPYPNVVLYREVAHWLKSNARPDASVAYLEIGNLGYYSGLHVVDTLGIASAGVVDHLREGDQLWAYYAYEPDYIVHNPAFGSMIAFPDTEPWFPLCYQELTRISHSGYPFPLSIYGRLDRSCALRPRYSVTFAQLHRNGVTPIMAGQSPTAQFTAMSDVISGVRLLMATYGKRLSGSITLEVRQGPQSAIMRSAAIDKSRLRDNAWLTVPFEPLHGVNRQSLQLVLTDSAPPEQAAAVYAMHPRPASLPFLQRRDTIPRGSSPALTFAILAPA
jgi:hypothetical protein